MKFPFVTLSIIFLNGWNFYNKQKAINRVWNWLQPIATSAIELDTCLSAIKYDKWKTVDHDMTAFETIIQAAFQHTDIQYLAYYLISFLFVGFRIEARFGSLKFALLSLVIIYFTGLLFIYLHYAQIVIDTHQLEELANEWFFKIISAFELIVQHLIVSCASGLVSTLTALKLVEIFYLPTFYLFNKASWKYFIWMELAFITAISNQPILFHLTGFLIGLFLILIKLLLAKASGQ